MPFPAMSTERPLRFAFLLRPQFSMMAFASALEPLRAANRVAGRALYAWPLVSIDGAPVEASNGIRVPVDDDLDTVGRPDLVMVCVGLDPESAGRSTKLRGWLRRLAAGGCQVGGITGGAFVLAQAGLLDGRRCAVHWEFADRFAQRHPRVRLVPDLFVVDRGVFTCSGGTAGLDLMLHFIRDQQGEALALAVAEQFIHPRIREQHDGQRMSVSRRYGVNHPRLARLLERMETSLANPPSMATLAAGIGVTVRQVERLFRQHVGMSPVAFQMQLRLEHARHLLRETAAPIPAVALDCGFTSASHFSHSYRRHFGRRPMDERQRSPGDNGVSVTKNRRS